MTNVIPFPARKIIRLAVPPPLATPPNVEENRLGKIIGVVWVITTLLWTVARFVIPVVVFWQFLRMIWLWDTPGSHAGWTFLAYFAGYSALYYFVAFYRPVWERDSEANNGGSNVRK